ncbi:MAG: leucine-rich repeat protein [Bacteroidales bacterium]|nr:leucine-rich repeat protein [Bacteroidales bacterium]
MNQDEILIENGVLKLYRTYDAEVSIPEGVHTIADGAMKGNAGLRKVSLPNSLRSIGASAFKGCRQLHDILFPDGLEEVGAYAFNRCHALEELVFPKSMTKIGEFAFLYCDSLRKVVLEGPTLLSRGVFSHDILLEEVALNKDVDCTNFAKEVFEGCMRIVRVRLSGVMYEFHNLVEAMSSGSDLPQVVRAIAESVCHVITIEDGVLKSFNINIKSVVLPEGITAIGKRCFYAKKGIESITLPESLKEIRSNAFLNCISIEEVSFLGDDVSLDGEAFRGCNNLKKVNLPGMSFSLEDDIQNPIVGRIRDQVLSDFYISGRILVKYLGDEEQVSIPKGVEIIGDRCFFGKEQLKTVLCPDGLSEIREQAFAGCLTLQNIVLPHSLKRIEREAFAECKKLLKCNVPVSLEYVGIYAFRRCLTLLPFDPWPASASVAPLAFWRAKHFEGSSGNLSVPAVSAMCDYDIAPYTHSADVSITSLNLRDVRWIGKYAFSACPNLEEIVIDAPDCEIEQNVFSTCPNLKRVRLRVKSLGKGVFSYCRGLESVVVSGVSSLPAECFAGCYSLSHFEAEDVVCMDARCFDECVRLDSFDFSGIRRIGERAFERCDSLLSVKLGAVECGYHAFADCASLESVVFSDETVLKSGAFIGCTQIGHVVYNGVRYDFCRLSDSMNHVDNVYPYAVRELIASIYSCFEITDKCVLTGYSQDATRVTIPSDIEEIGPNVFANHVRLRDICIPESVRVFGPRTFFMTAWVERLRKESGLIIVNGVLLDGAVCKGTVLIPDGVRRLASWCFAGNNDITELHLPARRVAIESLAFRNCINLRTIVDSDGTVYRLSDVSDLVSAGYPEQIQMIFSECINCFKLDENRNLIESTGNINTLSFPEGIRSIGDGVYQDCHLLEVINLSSDTERIGRSAFENSKWLRCVLNAHAVTSIGPMAFSGCQSLETVELSDNLVDLGARCFEHCSSLREIHLSIRLDSIHERSFFRCKSLKSVYIPKSVRVIESEAFAFCEQLEKVFLPEGTAVMDDSFAFCDKMDLIRYV